MTVNRTSFHAAVTPLAFGDLQALQALAEPNRARIIELLGHGEHCVCDVGVALSLSSALVSHHLRVLRASGLVRERRDGRWVHYALDADRLGRLRSTVVGLLTPTEASAAACACSDCGPATPKRDRVAPAPMQLEALRSGR